MKLHLDGLVLLFVVLFLIGFAPSAMAQTIKGDDPSGSSTTRPLSGLQSFDSIKETNIHQSLLEFSPYWMFFVLNEDQKRALLIKINDFTVPEGKKNLFKQTLMRLWHQHPVTVVETEDQIVISLDPDHQSQIPVQDQLTLQEIWDAITPPSTLETTDMLVGWGSVPHRNIIDFACTHNDIGCGVIARSTSNDPDNPAFYGMKPGPIWTIFHTYQDGYVLDLIQAPAYPPGIPPNPGIPYGSAPQNVGIGALRAKNAYRHNNAETAFKSLGHASHFLADVGNPVHTSAALFSEPVLGFGNIGFVHNVYEGFVSDHWQVFSGYVESTTEKKRINNPEVSAIALAQYSHARSHELIYRVFLDTLMNKPLEKDRRIHQITKECLIETTKYTNGLVDYVVRDGIATFTITASAGEGGVIVPSGAIPVKYDESRTFSIRPDSGYYLETLLVDGESVTPQLSYTFTDVERSHTIRATFSKEGPASSSEWIWSRDGWEGWDHSARWSCCHACSEFGPLIVGDHGEHGADVSMGGGYITATVGKVFSDTRGNGWNTVTFEGLLGASDVPGGRWMSLTINDRMLFYGTAMKTPPGNGKPFQIRVTFPTSTNVAIQISHGQDPAWGPRFMMQYHRITLSNDKFVSECQPIAIMYPMDSYSVNSTIGNISETGSCDGE